MEDLVNHKNCTDTCRDNLSTEDIIGSSQANVASYTMIGTTTKLAAKFTYQAADGILYYLHQKITLKGTCGSDIII